MIEFKENELYQEIEIFLNDKKIGDRELKNADLWQEIDKQLSGHAVRFQTEF